MLLPVVCMLGPLLTVVEKKTPMTLTMHFEILLLQESTRRLFQEIGRLAWKSAMKLQPQELWKVNSIHCIVQYIEYLTVCTYNIAS